MSEVTSFLNDVEDIKIILPAHKIPEGSTVTKPTGTKTYILHNQLKVYGDGDITITKSNNTRMLISESNGVSINIISDEDLLGWVISFSELYDLMQEEYNDYESK